MIQTNVDALLAYIAWFASIVFVIYAVYVFVDNAINYGFRLAVIRLFSYRVLIPLLIVMALIFLSMAVVFIQPEEVGVVISALAPIGVRPLPVPAGLRLVVPLLETAVRYPIYWQTYTMSSKMQEGQQIGDDSIRARTSDGQEVFLDCSVIFRINFDDAVTVHVDWQERYIEDLIRPVIRGVVRTQVSQFTVDEVNSSQRKDLEATLDRLLREQFTDKGFTLDQFLLRDITFSPEYAESIENKQIALEGEVQTVYQATQIRNLAAGRRDQYEIEAEGEAAAILLKAEAQAEALKMIADALRTSDELLTYEYIQKLSPNIRVMLVPSDTPLILPLPDLTATDMVSPSLSTTLPSSLPITSTANPVLNPIPALVPVQP